MAVCQNLVPLVNIKIAGKWMFIPLKMVLIGIDPYPNEEGGWNDEASSLGTCLVNKKKIIAAESFRHNVDKKELPQSPNVRTLATLLNPSKSTHSSS